MRIETAYGVGDVVWRVRTWRRRTSRLCEVCGGAGRVSVPGSMYKALCPEPSCDYGAVHVAETELLGEVTRLTIGQVRIERTATEAKNEYMAYETGVGSGQVHSESDLYPSRSEAERAVASEGATLVNPEPVTR